MTTPELTNRRRFFGFMFLGVVLVHVHAFISPILSNVHMQLLSLIEIGLFLFLFRYAEQNHGANDRVVSEITAITAIIVPALVNGSMFLFSGLLPFETSYFILGLTGISSGLLSILVLGQFYATERKWEREPKRELLEESFEFMYES